MCVSYVQTYMCVFLCASGYVRTICAFNMCIFYKFIFLKYFFLSPPGRPPDSPPRPFKAPENPPGSPIDYELSVYYAHLVSMTGLCRYVQQVSGGKKTSYHVTTLFPSMPLRAPQGAKREHQKKPRESTY